MLRPLAVQWPCDSHAVGVVKDTQTRVNTASFSAGRFVPGTTNDDRNLLNVSMESVLVKIDFMLLPSTYSIHCIPHYNVFI